MTLRQFIFCSLIAVSQFSWANIEIEKLHSHPKIKQAFAFIEQQQTVNNQDLITIAQTPAPPFMEQKRAALFKQMMEDAGVEKVTIDSEGNVIGMIPGTVGKRTVALGAHLDTVFPLETDVTVKVEGNAFHGPGVGDDSRGLVFLLSLAKTLKHAQLSTEDNILLIGTVGEEGLGDLRGMKHLFSDNGPKIDTFIGIDGSGHQRIIYSAVGSHRYRVTFKGPGGHSWGAFGLGNPHQALGRAISKFVSKAPSITNEGPKSSFSIGRIGGGTSINSIPFESWMEVDMRSGNQAKLDALDAVFQKAMVAGLAEENLARKIGPELEVDIKRVGKRPAGEGDESSSLVQDALLAIKTIGGTPTLSASSTDSNVPIGLGIPAITIGQGGVLHNAHSLDEYWEDIDSHLAIQAGLLITLSQANVIL